MKKSMLFVLLLAISFSVSAKSKNYGNVVVSEVRSIYDADTFRASIEGWPDIIGKSMSIRVNGIDAAEMRGKCQKEKDMARAAKQATVAMLREAKKIELRNMKRGKYFRIIADVYVDGKNLGEVLVNQGMARKYSGGKREGWCA